MVAESTAFHPIGLYNGNVGFAIGGLADGGWNWDGYINAVGYCSKDFTQSDYDSVYNNGFGIGCQEFSDLSTEQPSTPASFKLYNKIQIVGGASSRQPAVYRAIKPEEVFGEAITINSQNGSL